LCNNKERKGVEACTAENPCDRITILALLLRYTKDLSEAHDAHTKDAAPPSTQKCKDLTGPMKLEIRPDDRQKWDEVVRRLFIIEKGKPATEKLTWEFQTREVSVGSYNSSRDEDAKE
jgi:hypothetical protein